MSQLVIAIDGPAGAGKSTVARAVAERLGLAYVDTGATYRLVARRALDTGVGLDDDVALAQLARDTIARCALGEDRRLTFDGAPLGADIRTSEVSEASSKVAAVPAVRAALVEGQRRLVPRPGAVVEGRDIGTVVWPAAQLKVFLDADPAVRAERRSSDAPAAGRSALEAVTARDARDATRPSGAMLPAADAIRVDTTGLGVDTTVTHIIGLLTPDERDRLYAVLRATLTALLTGIFRLRIEGRELIPATGPVILAPNHRSLLDIPVTAAATKRQVYFMAKEELFGSALGAKILNRFGAFPVRRGRPDRGAVRRSFELLERGRVLGLFPEGTRRPTSRFDALEDGLAYMALKSGAPVVPLAIVGSEAVFPPGKRLPRPARIRALVGSPFTLGGPVDGVLPRARIREATAEAQTRFTEVFRRLDG